MVIQLESVSYYFLHSFPSFSFFSASISVPFQILNKNPSATQRVPVQQPTPLEREAWIERILMEGVGKGFE